ncbi:putative zinc binding dehydrogenase [Podospora appendiculata]|uniref:Zinc binding dehydrogenase n=1 Tax=Podospora appendiculata TaxID=314037 RepID=A0AAE0XAU0_9PEZI|nr:putative zinc binding dehydrogenase [Podospora appendiculata]
MAPNQQVGVVQSHDKSGQSSLSLAVSHLVPIPGLPSANHVLVQVLAVALNPTDFKMVTYFPQPGTNLPIGCDFCGVVKDGSETALASFPRGTRVCGGLFPYGHHDAEGGEATDGGRLISGAFAEWLCADAKQLLRVPDQMDDLQGAAIGGICWGTCVLALFADPEALALEGRPSKPDEKNRPVVVYGGATATGTMACQLLKLSGYLPIAVTSPASAPLARAYGAVGVASYTSPTCAETLRSLSPNGAPIRHVLDCITTQESTAISFAAMGRAGGRYACLEGVKDDWRTRRAIRVKEVMGFEGFGHEVALAGDKTYSRKANLELYDRANGWAVEMQAALDQGLIKCHPVREMEGDGQGGWVNAVVRGLEMLQRGEVRGQKLVVRVAHRT